MGVTWVPAHPSPSDSHLPPPTSHLPPRNSQLATRNSRPSGYPLLPHPSPPPEGKGFLFQGTFGAQSANQLSSVSLAAWAVFLGSSSFFIAAVILPVYSRTLASEAGVEVASTFVT
ncbi:hypothetical protein Pla108_23300 [Botrimarina colliarenosi]|uniref:Uncharacterized protein n=1 Tax=Botrimarina colliarenosi TaxID=2528001 RepID=A0A5C6AIW0_9BACT|nr:hypothetical protein Pla108_23300 [Botrimarina colliarenosi]